MTQLRTRRISPWRGPRRWLSALAAVLAGQGLVIFLAVPGPAQAAIPPHPVLKTASPARTWANGGYIVANNVLSSGAGPQTIWANHYWQWGVETTQTNAATVKAYPSVQRNFPAPSYSSFRYLRSGFTQSMPSGAGVAAEAAYELWLDNHAVEVMMWIDSSNRSPAGKRIGTIVFYKDTFVVWQNGPDMYTFVLSGPPQTTGTVHLLSALRWLVNNGHLNASDTLTQVDFGWEIASTGGTAADFAVTRYGVSSGMKHPPKTQPAIGVPPGAPWSLIAGLAGVFVALFLVAMLLVGRFARVGQDRAFLGMFEKYGPRRQQQPVSVRKEAESQGVVATAAVDAANRLMSSGAQDRLTRRLDLAGVKRRPAEWAVLGCCLGVGIAAALSLVTSYVFVGVLGGVVVGWLVMRLSLSVRILRRRAAFSDQLPDLLQLIASTLQAGFSLPQALDAVVRQADQPAAEEFSRALAEARIGADLDSGLDAIANRMDSDDLRWTVMAIRIQQGVGGNLAEVLLTIAETIRERAYLRRQVRALSAEGRLSAYVLIALPLVVAAWLFVSSASYMRPLYTTAGGDFLLVVATSLLLIGTFWMRRVIKVEV